MWNVDPCNYFNNVINIVVITACNCSHYTVACMYLASKVMESPKYLRDVIKLAETCKWAKWCDDHPTERRKWEDMVSRDSLGQALSLSPSVRLLYLTSPDRLLLCNCVLLCEFWGHSQFTCVISIRAKPCMR